MTTQTELTTQLSSKWDNRLKPDLEEKMLKEHAEWEKYKNRHNYPQVKLKRLIG